MLLLLGGILGYAAGAGVWLVVQLFVGQNERTPASAGPLSRFHLLRDVGGALSPLAALTQGGMALWGAYLGWRAPTLERAAPALLVTGLLLAISLIDLQTRRIPNALVLAVLAWAGIQVAWLGEPAPPAAILGLLEGGAVFLILALIRRGAMGAGDVKLAAALGAMLGAPLVCEGLTLGVLAAAAAAVFLLVTRRAGRKDYMAYGPYLCLGAWIVWTRALGLWP
jgi:leader peptidase (prepilin peptidase) / N-methyltransferase